MTPLKSYCTIPLTQGHVAIIDEEDAYLVDGHSWYTTLGRRSATRYAQAKIKGKSVLMHRLILGLRQGDGHVDHINGNGCDNRRENLRVVTTYQNAQNHRNLGRIPESGFRGVLCDKRWTKVRYRAKIGVDGRFINLGSFDTPQEAHSVYLDAVKKYHGEFAYNREVNNGSL